MGKVWNSTLQRKKEWRPKNKWQRSREVKEKAAKTLKKSTLKKKSKSQRRRESEYYPEQKQFIKENPWCQICIARGLDPRPTVEVHHKRGRAGKLISDSRFFVASCFYCRMWPHENPREARDAGVLAEAWDWNVYPRENTSLR